MRSGRTSFGAIVLLSAYGFFTALGGQPIFSAGFLKDELARAS
jgi:hypothetical protein